MNTSLTTIIMLIQVLSALTIIGLVLLQHGKGADMGAAFGSGASGSLFGATGSSNFLSKSTGIAAAIFFSATLALSFLSTNRHATVNGGVLDNLPITTKSAPVAPVGAAAPVAPAATGAPAVAPVVPAASAQQPAKAAPASPKSNQIPK
jgi:preprotein translocase subunit SecG